MGWRIHIKDLDTGGENRFLSQDPAIRIGRDPATCDMLFSPVEISRRHAQLSFEQGSFFLEDFQSKNATYLLFDDVWERVRDKTAITLPAHVKLGRRFLLEIHHDRMDPAPTLPMLDAPPRGPGPEEEEPATVPVSRQAVNGALPVATMVGPFRIRSVLGRGGFGIIYLAEDLALERHVALKEFFPHQWVSRMGPCVVVPNGPDDVEEFKWGLDSFLKEGRVLARLSHPNLVRVLTYVEAHGTAYMAMEFEQGENLETLARQGGDFSEQRLLALLPPLLSALEVVHKAGLIHRDIKPENILIRQDDSPVLLDFGAARQTSLSRKGNLTSLFSPGYAPFEQYDTQSESQGPWTDLYALGAVLYRLIAGRRPVDSQTRAARRLMGEADPLPSLAQVAQHHYSPRFLAAVEAAMRFQVQERPASIQAWRRMLP